MPRWIQRRGLHRSTLNNYMSAVIYITTRSKSIIIIYFIINVFCIMISIEMLYLFQYIFIEIDLCSGQPCENSGLCVANDAGFECLCLPNWKGPLCEEGEILKTQIGQISLQNCLDVSVPSHNFFLAKLKHKPLKLLVNDTCSNV